MLRVSEYHSHWAVYTTIFFPNCPSMLRKTWDVLGGRRPKGAKCYQNGLMPFSFHQVTWGPHFKSRLPAWWLNPKWSRLYLALLKSWSGNWRQRGYKGLREKREFQTLLGNCLRLPCGSAGKESTCYAGDLGSISGLGRSPGEGKGYPFQHSGLENSMDCIVHGVTKCQTRMSDSLQENPKEKIN